MTKAFTTPVGRLVEGDPLKFTPQTDNTGKPKLDKAGNQVMSAYIGLAVAKTDPAWPAFYAELMTEAKAAWAKYFDAAGNCTNPSLSLKIKDGDGSDKKGNSYASKQGFAGHWIVSMTRNEVVGPVRVLERVNGAYLEAEKGKVKLGDYIRASGNYVSNQAPPTQTEGMYCNLDMVLFEREGERIYVGTSPEQAFGGGAAPAASPPVAPPTPPVAVAPPPTPPAAAPPPAGPKMTAKANGVSYADHIKAGWTDEMLVKEGLMDAPYSGHMTAPPVAPVAPVAPPPAAPTPPPGAPRMTAKATAAGITYEALKTAGWTDVQMITEGYLEDGIPH